MQRQWHWGSSWEKDLIVVIYLLENVFHSDTHLLALTWCRRHGWCKTIENKRKKNEENNKNDRFVRWFFIVTCPVSSTPRRSPFILFLISTLSDWLKKFESLCHPIRTVNRDSLALVFPRFASATCVCFEFWLAHWIVCVTCNWLELFICFYDTESRSNVKILAEYTVLFAVRSILRGGILLSSCEL